MKRFLAVFILIFSSGCTTVEFVRKDLTPKKQAVVRYPPQSNPEKEQKFRNELNERATEFCAGPFEITKEYEALTESAAGPIVGTGFGLGHHRRGFGTGVFLGGSGSNERTYHFVELSCSPAAAATPAPTGP